MHLAHSIPAVRVIEVVLRLREHQADGGDRNRQRQRVHEPRVCCMRLGPGCQH